MKRTITGIFCSVILTLVFASVTAAQNCPEGNVCLPQATANEVFAKLNQLVAAKDLIAKLEKQTVQADAVIASAQRIIEDYKQLDVVNGMMIVKYEKIISLYEQTIKMYQSLVDKLEAKLNAPKSAFQKLVSILGKAVILLAGITVGRGL